MSKILMPKPSDKDLSTCSVGIFNGATVIGLFYNKGTEGEDFIPRVLDENAWVPKRDEQYKVWWHPNGLGYDVLDYIEEFEPNYKEELISKITERLSLLSINSLYNILKSI